MESVHWLWVCNIHVHPNLQITGLGVTNPILYESTCTCRLWASCVALLWCVIIFLIESFAVPHTSCLHVILFASWRETFRYCWLVQNYILKSSHQCFRQPWLLVWFEISLELGSPLPHVKLCTKDKWSRKAFGHWLDVDDISLRWFENWWLGSPTPTRAHIILWLRHAWVCAYTWVAHLLCIKFKGRERLVEGNHCLDRTYTKCVQLHVATPVTRVDVLLLWPSLLS